MNLRNVIMVITKKNIQFITDVFYPKREAENILADHLAKASCCHRKECPSGEELENYPEKLPEDYFDIIDEIIYNCKRCRQRLGQD